MQFKSQSSRTWKMFLSNEMNCSLQCRRQIFTWFELFLQKKVIFRALMHKITCLELLRTQILCLVQLSKIMRMRGTRCSKASSQWEKVAKCNFKSKAQLHEKCFFLMKWSCSLQCRRQIFTEFELFCRKSYLELNCTKSLV